MPRGAQTLLLRAEVVSANTVISIHDRAKQLAAQKSISLPDAYAELSRRGHERRKFRNYGVLHVTNRDRANLRKTWANVEAGPRFWWQDL